MTNSNIEYPAFGQHGEYMRNAFTIDELPVCDRQRAIVTATQNIGALLGVPHIRPIAFGLPVYEAFGMKMPDVKLHALSNLLMRRGCDVPLTYCARND